ncbi:MAG: hypothetical protein Unbinned7358contig1000_52 [Prokaryotic dsDNA virus sp.]|nr:MAG: hypothetical protein Unbinned7358contig1000_52 [Prokaryotic dsDNA virus sp.]
MSIEFYRNLNAKKDFDTWSLRMNGKVVGHMSGVLLRGKCKFVVQPAGSARVAATQRKNVHAFVRADDMVEMSPTRKTRRELLADAPLFQPWCQVSYRPKQGWTEFRWVSGPKQGQPVGRCAYVYLLSDGSCWATER